MAIQVNCEELNGCPGYLEWIKSKICTGDDCGDCGDCANLKPYGNLLSFLFVKDFFAVDGPAKVDDEVRATDAMGLRRRYAKEVGAEADKSDRDIDRIWKSVRGKCSVLELLLQLCFRLDGMVNEEEPGEMVGMFFGILLKNLGLKESDSSAILEEKVDRFLNRQYGHDGSEGGLFPLSEWTEGVSKDQKTLSIWYQMNIWLTEHLDDEEHFIAEK